MCHEVETVLICYRRMNVEKAIVKSTISPLILDFGLFDLVEKLQKKFLIEDYLGFI